MPEKVTFLVTSYNKRLYLPSVLASVARECAGLDGDIILIDDGSTDGSDVVCADFAAQYSNCRYIQSENHVVFSALNSILPLATGAWVRPVDSDDPLIAGSTAGMIAVATAHKVGFVFGGSISYGPDPLADADIIAKPFQPGANAVLEDALSYLVLGMNFTSTRVLYSAAALSACIPLPNGFISCQDFAMAMRAAKVTRFARTDANVCFYLRGVANQFIASESLTQHQTVALIRQFWPNLPESLRRKAISKLAMRARRWRNHAKGRSFVDATGLRLLATSLLAKACLTRDPEILDWIAALYEPDLREILSRRAVAY